jgi:hypothetical protein
MTVACGPYCANLPVKSTGLPSDTLNCRGNFASLFALFRDPIYSTVEKRWQTRIIARR